MVEGKLFKTKLCTLYQKGRCSRHSCTFAHGDAELRGHPSSFDGERNHRGADLRGRIDGWHSPPRRHSPRRRGWEGREQHTHIGHHPSTSLDLRSQKKRKFDHREEFSGTARFSNPSEDRVREKDGPLRSLTPVNATMEELKEVKSDIETLNARKSHLQLHLEEKDKEEYALSNKLKKLEDQLHKEKEESHRLASKIKKFVKAHSRHSRIEDDLKRSQARLNKLGLQLSSHITTSAAQWEDWSMNVMSEEEGANQILNSGNGQEKTLSLSKRGMSIDLNSFPGPHLDDASAGVLNEERNEVEAIKASRTSHKNTYSSPANHERGAKAVKRGDSGGKSKAIDRTMVKAISSTIHYSKHQSSESGHQLPSTSLAAHVDDEAADLTEMEKVAIVASALGEDNRGSECNSTGMQLPLPHLDNNSKRQSTEDALEEETVHVDVV